MKFIYLSILLITFSCGTKEAADKKAKDTDTTVTKTVSVDKKKDNGILDPKQDLMVVLKNPNKITETKELVTSSGLIWDKMVFNEGDLKVGLIRVPADKKDFWLNELIESGEFENVKLYSEEGLKELVKKEKKNSSK